MQLVTHTRINQRFFQRGSAPSKANWITAIEKGEVNGKVGLGKVWVDIDDFLSRDILTATHNDNPPELDLLHG